MPRQARIDFPGALHHVIGRGIERKKIFGEKEDKEEFLRRLKENLSKSSMQCYAWCIMNNHFHLLLQTGKTGLAEFMRQLLTGYAIYYNYKHKRVGHLFQNRYKSIVCEEDEYLLPLIRYIHLNPVRIGEVSLGKLMDYRWTGHKEMVGSEKDEVIKKDDVLGYFGETEEKARRVYLKFMAEGVDESKDYEGGGLIRSAGGFDAVVRRRKDEREMYDERILGRGSFVEVVLDKIKEGDRRKRKIKDMKELMERVSKYYRIDVEDIMGSREKRVRDARSVVVYLGNVYLDRSITELGKLLGIKQSGASSSMKRGKEVCLNREVEKKVIDQ